MNILFFLTPKEKVSHIFNDDTLRQVVEKMEFHGYSAIPLLDKEGKYIGTITEGDLLWYLKTTIFLTSTSWRIFLLRTLNEKEITTLSTYRFQWKNFLKKPPTRTSCLWWMTTMYLLVLSQEKI